MSRKRYGSHLHDLLGPVYLLLVAIPVLAFLFGAMLIGLGFIAWFVLVNFDRVEATLMLDVFNFWTTVYMSEFVYLAIGLTVMFSTGCAIYGVVEGVDWIDKTLLDINPNR